METLLDIQVEKYLNKEIDMQEFVDSVKYIEVYYTTPLGDHVDGSKRLFLLQDSNGEVTYFPMFSNQDAMMSFYQEAGRMNYMLLKGSFGEALKILDQHEKTANLGVLLDMRVPIAPGVRAN